MAMTLGALAIRHGCELRGDPATGVDRVATLSRAEEGALAFLANPQYRSQLSGTRASAVVLGRDDAPSCPVACLVSSDPYLTYARIAADLHPPQPLQPGVAAGAHVDEGCRVAGSCRVEAGAVLGAGASMNSRRTSTFAATRRSTSCSGTS